MKLLWAFSALLLSCWRADASAAGFTRSPLSQMKLIDDSAELHCEVIGNPIPEVQWWFVEGEEPNETFTQLFDGARNDRVHINATYIAHATSTIHLTSLTLDDSGTYECRASNDPDRNELKKTPKIKWIRSQANIIVIESEWQWKHQETAVDCYLLISEVLGIQLPLHPTAMFPGPVPSPSCFTQYTVSLFPQKLQGCPVVECKPGHEAWLGCSLIPYYPTQNMSSI